MKIFNKQYNNFFRKAVSVLTIFAVVLGYWYLPFSLFGLPDYAKKIANKLQPEIKYALAGSYSTSSPGTGSWTSPAGVTSVDVECWGAGGGGGGGSTNKDGAGGGGGGGYSKTTGITVVAETSYTVVVGAGGGGGVGAANGSAGGDSYFDAGANVLAKGGGGGLQVDADGGDGGAGGGNTGGGTNIGTTTYAGGHGERGQDNNSGSGGYGGGSGGTGSAGNGATTPSTAWSTVTAPAAVTGGGQGGDGGAVGQGGSNGASLGGGGGGAGEIGNGGRGFDGKCTITWTDESDPPTPDPMHFTTLPNNDGANQLSMESVTGSDVTTPIEYQFGLNTGDCGADFGTGGATSTWQSADTTYTDTGLDPNQCYAYDIRARDSVTTPNYTSFSAASSSYTSAAVPSAPTLDNAGDYTLDLTNNENGNPSSNPTTLFAAYMNSASPSDGDWVGKWINGSGNSSASEVWLTDAQLTSLTINGLNDSTTYGVTIVAKNEDGDKTASSTEGTGLTTTPAAPTIASADNQTFIIGDAATGIEAITVTDGPGGEITASNNLRISIATDTVDMLWDTTDTEALFSGTASTTRVSDNTVSYEDNGATLVIQVGSNFAAGETLIISGLSFKDFDSANSAVSALELHLGGSWDASPDATDSKTVAISEPNSYCTGAADGWAWAEKFGYITVNEMSGAIDYGITVGNAALTGYAWSEKTGWINFNDTGSNYGVENDGNGSLSGYAWSEKLGYISFSDSSPGNYYEVTISGASFSGYAWSEFGGYINMENVLACIRDYIFEGEIEIEGEIDFD